MGYVIEIEKGPTLYHAGDTDAFASMALIAERYHPTVALLPIGGHFTMDPAGAALAARMLKVKTVVPMHFGTFPALDGTPAQLEAALQELLEEQYERKRAEVGDEGMRVLERLVLLRVIDSLWVEHLTAVDDMRRGIGLRAYSQRDPLNEFKVEAYRMFDELKATIRHDVTHTIFRVTVMQEAAPPPPARRMLESRPDVTGTVAAGSIGTAAATASATVTLAGNGAGQPTRAGRKIGRNDPCWCGSGKKYKRCHGA